MDTEALEAHTYGVGVVDRVIVRMIRLQGTPVVGGIFKLLLKWRGTDIPHTTLTAGDPIVMHGASAVAVHPNVRLGRKVVIMHGVTLGRADTYLNDRKSDEPGITVGDYVFLGAGAAVLFKEGSPITLGEGSVIGANAVLTRSTGPGEIWAGSPARMIGTR